MHILEKINFFSFFRIQSNSWLKQTNSRRSRFFEILKTIESVKNTLMAVLHSLFQCCSNRVWSHAVWWHKKCYDGIVAMQGPYDVHGIRAPFTRRRLHLTCIHTPPHWPPSNNMWSKSLLQWHDLKNKNKRKLLKCKKHKKPFKSTEQVY